MDPNGGKKNMFNKLGRAEAMERLQNESFDRITISFYKYVIIENPYEFRDKLYSKWSALSVFGRIYVAKEGINAQMSIPQYNWERFKENLYHSYKKLIT